MLAEVLDVVIKERVKEICEKHDYPETDSVFTDNMGEILEKLIIVHIRTWMLEDAIQAATTDEEIAELKRKIDICFKQKRPKLVEAINVLFDQTVHNGQKFKEDSVKYYKGI